MKKSKFNIPTPPNAPSAPSAPNAKSIPSSGGNGAPDMSSIPGMGDMMERFASMGLSKGQIQKFIDEHDIDQYRDANGKITCPVSQEERDALKAKGMH